MKKILIIDDEQDMVAMLKYCLEAASYEVLTALNGVEGFVKARNESPNIIVLDMMMPNVDGKSFLEEVRWQDNLKEVPIVVCSGLSHMEEEMAEDSRVSAFFLKPYNTKNLITTIQHLVGDLLL